MQNGKPQYTPEAWLVACDISARRSRRRRERLRRYSILLNLVVFGLALGALLLWLALS